MLEGLMIGLSTAFSLTNILMVIGGCLIGTFIGMLPGLGPMSIIAIMIPVAITLGDPAGVGPEIVLRAVRDRQLLAGCRPLVIGHPEILLRAAKLIDVAEPSLALCSELPESRAALLSLLFAWIISCTRLLSVDLTCPASIDRSPISWKTTTGTTSISRNISRPK